MNKWVLPLMIGLTFQASAMAKDVLWTAHISADGEVLRASPNWIEKVKHTGQDNYFSQYKVLFNKDIVKQNPGFCSASAIDGSTEQRLMHGQARIIGVPTVDRGVTVNTQLVDVDGPSGNNSMEFLLMCTR